MSLYDYTEDSKDTWCVNAFHRLCGMNDGTTKICCMYEMTPNKKYPIVGKSPLSHTMIFGEFMEVREALSNGQKHDACRRCWKEEDAGRESNRVRDNKVYFESDVKYKPASLAKIELNLGNTCNIKCRTCAPSSSSTWMKEEHETKYSKVPYKDWVENGYLSRFYKHYAEDSPFWEDIEENLHTIKQFDFYGGEPFMSKKMWKLINSAKDKGLSDNIELHYNTNGTLWPENDLACWEDFEHVSLSFSIDGINDRFEFMRHPAKWETVLEHYRNAEKMRDKFGNMSLDWCITISNLNVFYLPETLEFFFKNISTAPYYKTGLYLNLVHGPLHFNVQTMHPELKETVKEKLSSVKQKSWITDDAANQVDGIINFMNNDMYDEKTWSDFKRYIDVHDKYRNENYYEIFPEFGELIKAK